MSLVDRLTGFVAALRAAGVPVSSAETLDAARAFGAVPLLDRDALRAGLAATLVKRPLHRVAFDTLFDLWFPAVVGSGTAVADDGEPDSDALRDLLRTLLLDGDDDALRRFARQAVESLGRAEHAPGRQSWFAHRVLRLLNPQTLLASLLDAVLTPEQRGTLAEQVARQTMRERMRAFEEYAAADVRRRHAEEHGHEQLSKTAVKPLLEQVDFLRASQQDLVALRRTVFPLARRLATRLTVRRRTGRTGRLDVRRTIRASLGSGGVPLDTKHRPHKPHKPELVVLCDVSGSVSGFAHFMLLLTFALREQFTRVRAFAFIDTCDEITRFLGAGSDLAGLMTRVATEADLVWFDGHSDYGHAFEVFAERYAEAITPRTSLLVLGDARNNYRATGVPTLRQLVAEARHAYWLNPEPRQQWGSGDSATDAFADVVEMVECRNAAQLEQFVRRLLPV